MLSTKAILGFIAALMLSAASTQGAMKSWDDGGGELVKFWGTGSNWTGNTLPVITNEVFIGNLAAAANDSVNLNLPNVLIGNLTLSNGADVITLGNFIHVTNNISGGVGATRLSGAGTVLRIDEHSSGPATVSFQTKDLTINSQAQVTIAGGLLQVDIELDNNLGGTLTGYGTVDLGFSSLDNDGFIVAARAPGDPLIRHSLSIDGSQIKFDLDGVDDKGDLFLEQNTTLDINGTLSDDFDGFLSLKADSILDMSNAWTLSGQIGTNADSPTVGIADTATIRGGALEINSAGIFVDSGTLIFESDLAVTGTSLIQFAANTTMRISGTTSSISAGANIFGSGGELLVNDTGSTLTLADGANVGVPLQNDGTLKIGASPGLASANSFEQTTTGLLMIELAGTTPGTGHDQLSVTGTASLAGTLDLVGIDSLPSFGDYSLTILTAGAVNGVFGTVPPTNNGVDQGHIGRGQFFEGVDYNAASVVVDIFQAAAGDTNGDRQIDNTDIVVGILGANSFGNGPGFDWTQGDFSGDTLVDNSDILAILATGLFGTGPYAANPTDPGVPADGVADLVIHTDGTAVLDTNGLAINGFILRSLGGNFTAAATLPFAFFQTNNENEASVGFATPPVSGLVELGQLYKPGSLPIRFSDLDFTYTVDQTAGLFDGNCIGCVPEPSTIVLLVIGLVGVVCLGWQRR